MRRKEITKRMVALKGPNAKRMIRNAKRIRQALETVDIAWNGFVKAWDQDKNIVGPFHQLQKRATALSTHLNNWPFD